MKKKNHLPVIITSCVVGAALLGGGIFAAVKLLGNKEKSESENTDSGSFELEDLDVKKYFEEQAKIISVTPVKNSDKTFSESDVVEELQSRGFEDYPIITKFTYEGEFGDAVAVSESSSDKHPMYETYFVTSRNELWVITSIDGRVSATPSSYNLEHGNSVPIEVSESEEIASYDASTNSIYITIPNSDVLDVRVVDRIDAETLETIDLEG